MNIFARLEDVTVVELFSVNRDELKNLFHPDFLQNFIEVSESTGTPEIGYSYENGIFRTPEEMPLSEEQVRAEKVALVQSHLDAAAQALNYDSIANAITYADEPAVLKFQREGQALRAWRSLVWERCYEILADVQAGLRDIPEDEELIGELPVFSL